MSKRLAVTLALAILGLPRPAAAQQETHAGRSAFALMPLERGVRDQEALAAVESALGLQLADLGTVSPPETTRRTLRRLRLRDVDSALPSVLRQVAAELQANSLVVATLHDVTSHEVPDLAVSIRFYDGRTGELAWAGFLGRTGLDGRKLLGLGVLDSMQDLAPEALRRLLAESPAAAEGAGSSRSGRRSGTKAATDGVLAVVPFTSYVEQDAQSVADAATEAARAVLFRFGSSLASPGCVRQAIRGQLTQAWGEIAPEARDQLASACMADRILTGAVERWEVAGTGLEPEPLITLSLRLLDAGSGRILWMGSREADGWDRESVLGIGRVFSRGALLDDLLTGLVQDMLRQPHYTPGTRSLVERQ